MTRVWSQRPSFLYLALFIAAYVLGCGFAQLLAIVPGTGISIWPPGGVFIATLLLTNPYSWPWWILAGYVGEMIGNALWFHSPLPAGSLIYVGNALEAVIGASLLNRVCGRPVRLESLREVLAFVVLGAGIAPIASATVGSAALWWFEIKAQAYWTAWPLFWIGDATGILLITPLAFVVLQNWRSKARLSAAQWMEAGILGLTFLGVAALSLSSYYLPFAYIIMPPLLWAAVRFEFRGVAVALSLLALLTMALTISGDSQFVSDPESQRQRQIMLQLFLVISALSALIVAAISRQYQQALLTLRQSEGELSQLVNMIPVHIRRLTSKGEPTFFNKRLIDFYGLKDLTDLDKPDMSRLVAAMKTLVHPDDSAKTLESFRCAVAAGAVYSTKYRLRRADGVYRWMETRGEPLRDLNGEISQWYVISIDIDDEVHAQAALRDRERELSQLVNMVPVHIRRLTPKGETIFFNKRLIDFVGLDAAELGKIGMSGLDQTIQTLVHPDDSASLLETIRHSLATGEDYAMKYRVRRADGVYRWMEGRGEPLRDPHGAIMQWYGISIDIDDEMRAQHAEEALRQASDKLARAIQAASLAELSASIAHEVNQPLAAIVANSHACQRWLSAEPPNLDRAKATAERITRDANSAADVVSRIRALFRQAPDARSPEDVNRLIGEVCRLMADEIAAKGARIETDLEAELPLVTLDRVQVQQVLVNLIRNGIEAMVTAVERPRVIRISSSRDDLSAIRVEVRDAGTGIKDTERVFEPFFTTKPQGMGIGLTICRSIVESHGGHLSVAGNDTHGATAAFTLPLAASQAREPVMDRLPVG